MRRATSWSVAACPASTPFSCATDLLGDNFFKPGLAVEHYEPPRYFLAPMQVGHPAAVGPVVTIG